MGRKSRGREAITTQLRVPPGRNFFTDTLWVTMSWLAIHPLYRRKAMRRTILHEDICRVVVATRLATKSRHFAEKLIALCT